MSQKIEGSEITLDGLKKKLATKNFRLVLSKTDNLYAITDNGDFAFGIAKSAVTKSNKMAEGVVIAKYKHDDGNESYYMSAPLEIITTW
jgi:hypothetical protein